MPILSAPLVSIIIPCYNNGHLLHETLDSLKRQTYQNWECIIVNDGSPDNTEQVALAYADSDSRFKYIFQENKGVSAARNKGIELANGAYIQLLDGDDILEPDKFAAHVQYLQQHPDVDMVYGDALYFYSGAPGVFYKSVNGTQNDWMPRVSGSGEAIVMHLAMGNIMAIHCPLVKKEVYTQLGAFNEALRYNEDWELFMRWAQKGANFHYLNQNNTAALVRIHKASVSQDKWNMRLQELEMKESMMKQGICPIPESSMAYELDKLRVSLYLVALSAMAKGQVKIAGKRLLLAIKKSKGTGFSKNIYRILTEKVKTFLKTN